MASIRFHNKEKECPLEYTKDLASKLHYFPMKNILGAKSLLGDFDYNHVIDAMKYLNPKNMIAVIAYSRLNNPSLLEEVTKHQSDKWMSCGLNIPTKNNFIANNFDIYARNEEERGYDLPKPIRDDEYFRIYHKQDTTFNTPRAFVNLKFTAGLEPQFATYFSVLTMLIRYLLSDDVPGQEAAGFDTHIDNGISLSIEGFSDKLGDYLDKIIEKMTQPNVDPDLIQIIKDEIIVATFSVMRDKQYTIDGLLHHFDPAVSDEVYDRIISKASMDQFMKQFLACIHIEGLFYGNITKTQSKKDMITKSNPISGYDNKVKVADSIINSGIIWQQRSGKTISKGRTKL